MSRYDYTVMPGEAWYGPSEGKFLEDTCVTFREATKVAKTMHHSGVRDIVINAYDLEAGELADFYYSINDTTGKITRRA